MSLSDVKSRIAAVDAEALADATSRLGDDIRGWWACVGNVGVIRTERVVTGGLEAGLQKADALADEAVAAVIIDCQTPLSDGARALVGLLCGVDASRVTPSHTSDTDWMRNCARIRDLQVELRDQLGRAIEVVDADVATTSSLLLGLAARRTPALLIGPHAHAAAIIAQRQSVAATSWWRSAVADTDPVVARANERLQYESWIAFRTRVDAEVLDEAVAGILAGLQR